MNNHCICLTDFAKNPLPFIQKFWSMTTVPKTAAIQWGLDNEKNAIRDLEIQLGGKIKQCGLFVSKTHQFLGASPDGIFEDHLVEIKCPFILKDSEPTNFSNLTKQQKWSFCCTLTASGLKLKKNHKYYGQVMCQMFCTGYRKTMFII